MLAKTRITKTVIQCHPQSLSMEEMSQVYDVLEQYHSIFSLDEGKRAETNRGAVKAVLGTPNLTGKHACWWSKIHGSGIGEVNIVHRAWKEYLHADALSCQPVMLAPTDENSALEVQVAKISIAKVPGTLSKVLEQQPKSVIIDSDTLSSHQLSDPDLRLTYYTLSKGE